MLLSSWQYGLEVGRSYGQVVFGEGVFQRVEGQWHVCAEMEVVSIATPAANAARHILDDTIGSDSELG